jgi:hypothetical protein
VEGLSIPQVVATLILRGTDGHYPAGQYVFLYDGKGEFEFGYDATVISRSPGRIILSVVPSDDGILVRITRSSVTDHVRNIRLIMPGFESLYKNAPFNPLFLERLKPFRAIRFMDWQRTNNSRNVRWRDRTMPSTYTQAGEDGVAVEYMIDLSNRLGADPWFCMPHGADDDFIWNFAELVKERLDPERKVYLEFSNEVWNPQFDQHHWVNLNGPHALSHPAKYASFARNIFRIWEKVFGEDKDRIVRVVSGQAVNPWVIKEILKYLGPDGADAIAVTAYFGLPDNEYEKLKIIGKDVTVNQILDSASKELYHEAIPALKEHAAIASRFNMDLLVYEGGQHIAPRPLGTFPPFLHALWDAQKSDRLYNMYIDLICSFKKLGGRLFMAFSFVSPQESQFGSWGHLDYLDQSIIDAPKYQALLELSDTPVYGE